MDRRNVLELAIGGSTALLAGCTGLTSDGSSCASDPIEIENATWANAYNDAGSANAAPELEFSAAGGWRVGADFPSLVPMVGTADALFAVERDGADAESVRAIDRNGDDAWTATTELDPDDVPEEYLRFVTHLATDGRRVYVAARFSVPDGEEPTDSVDEGGPNRDSATSMRATLTALNADDGSREWSTETWRPLDLTVDPSGRLYLAAYSDRNFRSGTYDGLDGSCERALRVRAFDARTGNECWEYGPEEGYLGGTFGGTDGIEFDPVSAHELIVDDDFAYLPLGQTTGSDAGSTEIHVIDNAEGERDRMLELPFAMWWRAAVVGDLLYVDGKEAWTTPNPAIAAIDAESGDREWETPILDADSGTPTLVGATRERVVAAAGDRLVGIDAVDGAERWSTEIAAIGATNRLPVVGDSALVPLPGETDAQSDTFAALRVLDLDTGDRRADLDFDAPMLFHGAIAAGRTLYVALEDSVSGEQTIHAIR